MPTACLREIRNFTFDTNGGKSAFENCFDVSRQFADGDRSWWGRTQSLCFQLRVWSKCENLLLKQNTVQYAMGKSRALAFKYLVLSL